MEHLERVLTTFAHNSTDRIAVHHIGFSSKAASHILGHEAYVGGGIQQWREAFSLWDGGQAHEQFIEKSRRDVIELTRITKQDILRYEYWRLDLKPCKVIDRYTLMFGDPKGTWEIRRLDPETELFQVVAQSPRNEATFEEMEKSVASQEDSYRDYHPTKANFGEVEAIVEEFGDEYAVRVGGGSIGVPTGSRTWLYAVVVRPDIVARYLDVQAEIAVRYMKPLSEVGAKFV
jgi:hypothetical protein